MPYSHLTNAVISSDDLSQHDLEMLQKDVAVRVGDDSVNVEFDDLTPEEEEEDSRVEIKLDTETGEVEGLDGVEEYEDDLDVGHSEPDVDTVDDLPEFKDVDPKVMIEAADLMKEAQAGQDALFNQALEKGLESTALAEMKEYYMDHGKLSKSHYAALEEVGYSKTFIDSYIKGQDAVAEKYANAVMSYCGGQENYNKVTNFMATKQPHMVDAFNGAVERGDINTIRALLDATKVSMNGSKVVNTKAPKRNIAAIAKAKPVKANVVIEGYKSKAEMVKDMSDPRYSKDASFRRQVELKVLNAQF